MTKADELYNMMRDYYLENNCWNACKSAKGWNEALGASFSPATFSALYNKGKLQRIQEGKLQIILEGPKKKVYYYELILPDDLRQKKEEFERSREIERAKQTIEFYEGNVARIRENYERQIKDAEKRLAQDLAWETERFEKAKALLASN